MTRYLHGTSRALEPGTILMPGARVGRNNFSDLGDGHSGLVFVTTNIADAVDYGMSAVMEDQHPDADLYVYEVDPIGPVVPVGRQAEEFTCAQARIVREYTPEMLRAEQEAGS